MLTPGHEYIFSYVSNKNSVTFDGVNLVCKIGAFRKKYVPFNSIQHYYVFDNSSARTLYITYLDEKGKLKRVQLMAQIGEIGFRNLVEALNNTIGAKNLNHLSEKEAFAVMKATNPKRMAAVFGIIVIFAITTGIFYSGIRHFFDFGFANAEVQELIAGKDFGTRNLNLSGVPLNESLEETTTSSRSSTTTKKVFIPLVPPDWEYGQNVKVVMRFDELSDSEFDAIQESSEFVGVVRNIGTEGLDEDQRDFFRTEYDITVSDDAILFEVTGEKHNDALMFWLWVGINLFFVVIITVSMLRRR